MSDASEQIDRLADLFLSGAAPARAKAGDAARASLPAVIETLLVGNLPVRAGLWLTQYADEMAQRTGPVGLLRLDESEAILEVVRGTGNDARITKAPTLRQAVGLAARSVRLWLVRPPEGFDEESIIASGVDRVTILSGADEAAIVNVYTRVRALVQAAEELALPVPVLGLAIIGASPERAQEAAERIARTTQEHLGFELPLVRVIERMGALGSTLHRRFVGAAMPSLDDIIAWIDQPIGEEAAFADATESDTGREAPSRDTKGNDAESEPRSEREESTHGHRDVVSEESRSVATPPAETTPGPESPPPHASAVARGVRRQRFDPVRLPPRPQEFVEPKKSPVQPRPTAASAAHEQSSHGEAGVNAESLADDLQGPDPEARSLTSWIEGLGATDVRCPWHEDIEIAVDPKGGLHVIARDESMRELRTVEAWAKQHAKVIALACRDQGVTGRSTITAHVVTDTPVKVADLHESGVKLHVVAPVQVGSLTAWYAAPLSV